MSREFDSNILQKRYRATVAQGRLRFSEPVLPSKAWDRDYKLDNHFHVEYIHSVQVDLHPADFNRLCDTLEYIHGDNYDTDTTAATKANWPYTAQTPQDHFIHETYRRQEYEERMRAKHPLLQDLWQQYQMTLNLIASGQSIGTE